MQDPYENFDSYFKAVHSRADRLDNSSTEGKLVELVRSGLRPNVQKQPLSGEYLLLAALPSAAERRINEASLKKAF